MNKWTQAPWHVGSKHAACTIYDKFGQRIANAFEGVMVAHRSDEECIANARLIASAPELYEALCDMVSDHDDLSEATLEFARAALAKARGES